MIDFEKNEVICFLQRCPQFGQIQCKENSPIQSASDSSDRGWWICAFSYRQDLCERTHYWGWYSVIQGEGKTEVNVIQWLDQNSLDFMRGKRVLIVDEVDDTRTTLHYCVDRLRNEGISDLGVFVLHFKNKPKKELDVGASIYGAEVATDTWIVYPWEADNIEEHDKNCL